MTHRMRGEKLLSSSKQQIGGGLVTLALFVALCYLITISDFNFIPVEQQNDQVRQIGVSFLTEHLVAFELIALKSNPFEHQRFLEKHQTGPRYVSMLLSLTLTWQNAVFAGYVPLFVQRNASL